MSSVVPLSVRPCCFTPLVQSPCVSADRDHFQLGSLSHLLNAKTGGYQELPDWPEAAPDPSVRNVEVKESVRAVGTVTYRDTGALWGLQGPRKMEGSEGCSCPRAVPQRSSTELPELHFQYNIDSSFTSHFSSIYCPISINSSSVTCILFGLQLFPHAA